MNIFASSFGPGLIALTETWLTDSVSDAQIDVTSYAGPLRADRRGGRKGGGVCCYVRGDIVCKQLLNVLQPPESVDCLGMIIPACKLVLILIYIPPNLSEAENQRVLNFLLRDIDKALECLPDGRLILMGDFNHFETAEIELLYSLVQLVNFPTRGSSKLDKFFVDFEIHNELVASPCPPFGKSDHISIQVTGLQESCIPQTKMCKVFDLRKSNMNAVTCKLLDAPWVNWFRNKADVDSKTDEFYHFIDDAISTLPYHFVQMKVSDKEWMTPTLKLLINCKHEAYRLRNFSLFEHYKEKVKTEVSKAKNRFLNELKNKKNGLWKVANSIQNKRKDKSQLLSLMNCYSTPHSAVETINDSFCGNFSPSPQWPRIIESIPKEELKIWQIDITVEAVHKALLNLNVRKSTGSDGLSSRIMHDCADVLAAPLAHIFCMSVHDGVMPRRWKTAHVSPIPKSKHVSVDNLRPISLLPVASKMLENFIVTSLKNEFFLLYGKDQYGFRTGSSTLTAQLALHDFVTCFLDQNPKCCIFIISFDMSRAFDKLDHACLMKTLTDSDLPSSFLTWCSSFLQQRYQRVKINEFVSSPKKVTSGVPQGSKIAPYLFSCHMRTLHPFHLSARIFKYADDVVIVKPVFQTSHINDEIKVEIDNMKRWCDQNGLSLNEKKTKLLFFNKRNLRTSILPAFAPSSEMKLLGVVFHENLCWDSHVTKICKLASQRIYILKQLKKIKSISKNDLLQVYGAYIRSILEFNCPLFIGMKKKNKRKMNLIRNRCHRIVCGNECHCDDFENLDERRERLALKTFVKMLDKNHILHNIMPQPLPSGKRLSVPFCHTERRKSSFIPMCTLLYNEQFSKT